MNPPKAFGIVMALALFQAKGCYFAKTFYLVLKTISQSPEWPISHVAALTSLSVKPEPAVQRA